MGHALFCRWKLSYLPRSLWLCWMASARCVVALGSPGLDGDGFAVVHRVVAVHQGLGPLLQGGEGPLQLVAPVLLFVYSLYRIGQKCGIALL